MELIYLDLKEYDDLINTSHIDKIKDKWDCLSSIR